MKGPSQYMAEKAEVEKVVGVLKRLIRRKGAYPFIVATIEPKCVDGCLLAAPVIVSRGMGEKGNSFLVDALLKELAHLGAIRPAGGGEEPTT